MLNLFRKNLIFLIIKIFKKKLLIVNFGKKKKSKVFLEIFTLVFAIDVKIIIKKLIIYEI